MLLLAANDRRETIEADIVRDAIDLVEWQLQMRRLHDPIEAEGAVARMEQKVIRQLEARGIMTQRQLIRHTNADKSGLWAFDAATNNLIEHDFITRSKPETGKPGRNPLIYELAQN